MLLVALVLIPIAMFYFAVGWFGLFGWIMAPLNYMTGHYIKGGLWLCIGLYGLNFYFGQGEDYRPLYVVVMSVSLLAAFVHFCRKDRTAEVIPPSSTVPEATVNVPPIQATRETIDLVRNKHGVYTPRR